MSEEKKLNLKLEDVRLKGCSLTMGVAAENLGLSSKLCISLLEVLHYQGNYILMSGNFQKKVHEVSFFEEVSDIQEFLDGGLIEKVDNHEYQLTQRFIEALLAAAEIQKQLNLQGFPFSEMRCSEI